jgi:hypothetical protein
MPEDTPERKTIILNAAERSAVQRCRQQLQEIQIELAGFIRDIIQSRNIKVDDVDPRIDFDAEGNIIYFLKEQSPSEKG